MNESNENQNAPDPEIQSISEVYHSLRKLDSDAQRRVLEYVAQKLNLGVVSRGSANIEFAAEAPLASPGLGDAGLLASSTSEAEDDGINPVAQRWMKRSGFTSFQLSSIFSIGGDNIDLIAKKVPGKNKKERVRSVLLLKAIASYLATGAARTSHADTREACEHYDAWDSTNFATYLKSFAAEIGGSKESGYSLNARGLASATELIKETLSAPGG